jgi:hypothetical protein
MGQTTSLKLIITFISQAEKLYFYANMAKEEVQKLNFKYVKKTY